MELPSPKFNSQSYRNYRISPQIFLNSNFPLRQVPELEPVLSQSLHSFTGREQNLLCQQHVTRIACYPLGKENIGFLCQPLLNWHIELFLLMLLIQLNSKGF